MDSHTAYYLIAGALIVIGLLGTVLPVLPGLPVMFAGMLVAAWADDFQRIGAGPWCCWARCWRYRSRWT